MKINLLLRRCFLYYLPFLFLFPVKRAGCQNLLANGGFEDENTCTEYKAQCAPAAWFVVSPPQYKWPAPKEGEHTLALLYDNVHTPMLNRSYPYTRILCPLLAGREYDLSFWLYTGYIDFTFIDVLLDRADPTRYPSVIGKTPPTLTLTKKDITRQDPDGWVLLKRRFTPDEEKNFLLLGNLQLPGSYSPETEHRLVRNGGNIVFWIDDISLSAADSALPVCTMYNYYKSVLYGEHHRHTAHLYLDSFPRVSNPYLAPADTLQQPRIPTPPFIPPFTDTLQIPDVFFTTNSSVIRPAYNHVLDSLIAKIRDRMPQRIEIGGYTDSIGTEEFNNRLSLQRAGSLKKKVIEQLPSLEPLTFIHGYGRNWPLAPNNSPAHRARNRRVEIILIY